MRRTISFIIFTYLFLNVYAIAAPIINLSTNANQQIINATKFKLLVWNIYKGKKTDWSDDLLFLGKDADIILLQEGLESLHTPLQQIDNFSFDMAASFQIGHQKNTTGVISGSKYLKQSAIAIKTKRTEPISNTPKTSIITTYLIKGQPNTKLMVINIHALNFVRSSIYKTQFIEIEDYIVTHNGPIIFAGDFNAWNEAKEKVLNKFIKKYNFIEVQFEKDFRTKFNGHALDYVFIRDLQYSISNVHADILSSDHKPLSVTLLYNQ